MVLTLESSPSDAAVPLTASESFHNGNNTQTSEASMNITETFQSRQSMALEIMGISYRGIASLFTIPSCKRCNCPRFQPSKTTPSAICCSPYSTNNLWSFSGQLWKATKSGFSDHIDRTVSRHSIDGSLAKASPDNLGLKASFDTYALSDIGRQSIWQTTYPRTTPDSSMPDGTGVSWQISRLICTITMHRGGASYSWGDGPSFGTNYGNSVKVGSHHNRHLRQLQSWEFGSLRSAIQYWNGKSDLGITFWKKFKIKPS